jgi:DNA-binding IclR family transcriptional regulator
MIVEPPSTSLQSVERALDVLCAFENKDEFGISELSRVLKLPKSAVHRVMLTLVGKGFVEQNSRRRYRLGLKILELGNVCRLRLDLASVAQPILNDLSIKANSNVHLAKLDGTEVVDLVRIEFPAPLRVARAPMLRRPAHCTALGKAMLAFGKPYLVERVLAEKLGRLTRKTIVDPARFRSELQRTRTRGYAIDNEEFYSGTRCVAAPVCDESGEVVAAVSVSGLITHVTEDRLAHLGEMVMESARAISMRLGNRELGGTTT